MRYCIDTSALMDAWSRWYPPEVFPSLWARMAAIEKRFCRIVDQRRGKAFADPFVIATAALHELIVVTGEKPTGRPDTRPKIPDVCKELGIECIGIVEMIRREGWSF